MVLFTPPKLSTLFAPAGPSTSDCPRTGVPSQAPEGLHQAPHQGTNPSAKSSHSSFGDSFLAGQNQDRWGDEVCLHSSICLFLGCNFFLSHRIRSVSPQAHPAQEGWSHQPKSRQSSRDLHSGAMKHGLGQEVAHKVKVRVGKVDFPSLL